MIVYLEYAFAENFLIDGVLLYLAFYATKTPISAKRLIFAATVGAILALAYPLIPLSPWLQLPFKAVSGALICLLAYNQKEVGRYALTTACFFCFSFAFAGGVFALNAEFTGENGIYKLVPVPTSIVLCALAVFALFCARLVMKFYQKRAVERWIYDCVLSFLGKEVQVKGFLDTGNLAQKNQIPVCFVAPQVFYTLYDDKAWGQVCDELAISTLSGEKTLPLYKGEIAIKNKEKTVKKEVYFSPSARMISREYAVLLHSRIFEEQEVGL